MRVEGNNPIRPAVGRRDDRVGGTGSFAEALGAEPAAAPTAAAPLGGIGGLFALQEVPDPLAQRRKALARAGRMLDRLGELQMGFLNGVVDRASLADLAATARAANAASDDPVLQGIMAEIELRAAVELAKLSGTS